MSTETFNVSHVSTTVPFVQVKLNVLSVTVDSSSKTQNVLPDATSDSTFQVSSAKDVKMAAHIVKEPELVLCVRLGDLPTTDCAMSTAQLDQSPKSPT
jgi:hypothetical protein